MRARTYTGRRVPDRWAVAGADQHGERFEAYFGDPEDAEDCLRRLTRRGGDVAMWRQVWDGPAAAYRDAGEGE